MTIDEAIECERNHRLYPEYHKQIAEWLEELKALREKNETLKALYEDARKEGNDLLKHERNKAIDDFVKEFKRKTPMENKLVDEIAEQLKVGGNNGTDNQ